MNEQTQVIVIGAGLSGLAAAYELHKRGVAVRVLEASDRTGGMVYSINVGGFELDLGPNSLVVTPFLDDLIKELHLDNRRMPAAPVGKNRFLVKDKILYALSPHPLALLRSPYLSWGAKGHILLEWFRPRGKGQEESISGFFTRRLGKEVTEAIVDPVFSGIYAGNIERLSCQEILPALVQWEKQYGSLIKALWKNKAAMKSGRTLLNFSGGMSQLTDALGAPVKNAIQTGVLLKNIQKRDEGYQVSYAYRGADHTLQGNSLIYTAPAHTMSGFSWFDVLTEKIDPVAYAPIRTLHVSLPSDAVNLPEGFGFLVPSRENLSLLGCIFTSVIFPAKAPQGRLLLTVLAGGAHHSDELLRDPDQLQQSALAELSEILGISSDMMVLHAHTWNKAIPQKNVGFDRIKQSLLDFEKTHPNFYFAGNTLSGVSIGDTIEYALKIVHSMI